MPITFLHAADVHLDSPLRGLERYEGAPVERIRGASRRAFERLVELAIDRRVDFVLIAGDLYDGDWPDYNTGLYLVRQLARLRDAGIPVVMIAGNHDAANHMTRTLRLPSDVRLLSDRQPETFVFDGLGVKVHGQSFARRDISENLSKNYPRADPGCVNIGLLHTALSGNEDHERYAPCDLDDLRGPGYDYWALGHIHKRDVPSLAPLTVFPGNIQGRHARETGEKGCVLVTVDRHEPAAHEFHRLDVVRWERCRVDATDVATESELDDRVASALAELMAEEPDPSRLLAVRLDIKGACAIHDHIHAHRERVINESRSLAIQLGAERLWVEKVELGTRSPRAAVVTDGPLVELMEALTELRGDPDALVKELAELKKKLPRALVEGPDAPRLGDPQWLGRVLDESRSLLLDLLREDAEPS